MVDKFKLEKDNTKEVWYRVWVYPDTFLLPHQWSVSSNFDMAEKAISYGKDITKYHDAVKVTKVIRKKSVNEELIKNL